MEPMTKAIIKVVYLKANTEEETGVVTLTGDINKAYSYLTYVVEDKLPIGQVLRVPVGSQAILRNAVVVDVDLEGVDAKIASLPYALKELSL